MGKFEVIEVDQGTEEWHRARAGIPTASRFKDVLANGRGGEPSKTRRKYLYELAGEIISGEPMETYSNAHMDRGKEMEAEARALYEFMTDTAAQQVGFIRRGRAGCSPDALIGDDGMAEIKTKLPSIMVETILSGRFPPAHKAQVQGQLWIAEREWCDLVAYYPRMPPFIIRAERDEAYIAKLSEAVDAFNEELDEIVQKVKEFGGQA